MKTPEDEAFDELARKQGAWGGGFQAKRAAAADKQEPWGEDEWRRNNWRCGHGWLRGVQCEICNAAQEPPSEWEGIKAILDEYGLQAIDFVADFKAALAGREWNFCERCGKRTKDLTTIHTCTPPQEKNNA
jgi:hypothetical protein